MRNFPGNRFSSDSRKIIRNFLYLKVLCTTSENSASFGTFPSPIGWKLTECIREQTDGRTDIWQIISFDYSVPHYTKMDLNSFIALNIKFV